MQAKAAQRLSHTVGDHFTVTASSLTIETIVTRSAIRRSIAIAIARAIDRRIAVRVKYGQRVYSRSRFYADVTKRILI